jgi:hypothetical protein
MLDIEIERYVDRVIYNTKKELRETLLTDLDEIFIKASLRASKQPDSKEIFAALRYEVENKIRMVA